MTLSNAGKTVLAERMEAWFAGQITNEEFLISAKAVGQIEREDFLKEQGFTQEGAEKHVKGQDKGVDIL